MAIQLESVYYPTINRQQINLLWLLARAIVCVRDACQIPQKLDKFQMQMTYCGVCIGVATAATNCFSLLHLFRCSQSKVKTTTKLMAHLLLHEKKKEADNGEEDKKPIMCNCNSGCGDGGGGDGDCCCTFSHISGDSDGARQM